MKEPIMNLQETSHLKSKIEQELLGKFSHEIFGLELELIQLHRSQQITQKQLQKRSQYIQILKNIHEQLNHEFHQRTKAIAQHTQTMFTQLPSEGLSTFEKQTVLNLVNERIETYQWLNKEVQRVQDWVDQCLNLDGGWRGLLNLLNFSPLRRLLVKFDYFINKLKSEQTSLKKYSSTLLQNVDSKFVHHDQDIGEKQLQKAFEDLNQRDQFILVSQMKIKKSKEELRWKRSWLKLQEDRLKHYFPHLLKIFNPKSKIKSVNHRLGASSKL